MERKDGGVDMKQEAREKLRLEQELETGELLYLKCDFDCRMGVVRP